MYIYSPIISGKCLNTIISHSPDRNTKLEFSFFTTVEISVQKQ